MFWRVWGFGGRDWGGGGCWIRGRYFGGGGIRGFGFGIWVWVGFGFGGAGVDGVEGGIDTGLGMIFEGGTAGGGMLVRRRAGGMGGGRAVGLSDGLLSTSMEME